MNSINNNKIFDTLDSNNTPIPDLNSKQIIQIAEFLPKHERNKLFEAICENQEAFQDISISKSNVGRSLYLPLELGKSNHPKTAIIRKASEYLSKHIIKLLPKLFATLQVEPFPVSHIPLTFINGLNFHTSVPHVDESGGRFRISILYYFHKTPKAFEGGTLQFYDTDASYQNGYNDVASAKIDHEDNLLIAFPCQTYHGVTNVQLDSNVFEDGRFVAVGFLGSQ